MEQQISLRPFIIGGNEDEERGSEHFIKLKRIVNI
jgi:hypothetical protein